MTFDCRLTNTTGLIVRNLYCPDTQNLTTAWNHGK